MLEFCMVMIYFKDNKLFFHGGFEPDKPNLPLDSIIELDLSKI